MLSPNIDKTIDEIFESLIKEYDRMDDRVEGGRFNFKFVSSLNFSCENLNLPRKSYFSSHLIFWDTKMPKLSLKITMMDASNMH